MTAVKVCCIQSAGEARLAAEAGAGFLGLVGAMPSGPGPLPDEAIAAIAGDAPHGATPVLLTSRVTAADIAAHVRAVGVPAVQLVRALPPAVRRDLRALVPDLTILQVVHVESEASVAEALAAAAWSDHLLLDSGRPSAPVPEFGGTGRVHDWSVSAEIVARAPVPVFLAGGLRPENVAQAVKAVRPFGVDVCSGLRGADGRLDASRMRAFMAALAGPDGGRGRGEEEAHGGFPDGAEAP